MSGNREHEVSNSQIEDAEAQIIEQSKKIEFYLSEYSIELLASKMREGEFFVPKYQREFTWEEKRKSRFIESILMGLPIPFLFFWECPKTGKLEIVDGSQRLRTIEEFLFGDLKLEKLEKLPRCVGLKFSDLPESRQRKVKNRSIRGIVLSEHADEEARFDLFDRINTGSKVANTAEVRRGALGGPFLDLVISLAEYHDFVELAPMAKKSTDERVREELVTRFFAYGDGLEGYKDDVAPFNFRYTKKMNRKFEEEPEVAREYETRFKETMAFVKATFSWGFRKSANGTATPMSRFEAIAVGSYLAIKEHPGLKEEPPSVSDWIESSEFKQITASGAANVKSKLIGRMYYVRDRLLEGYDERV
jgi:hypothetical protein